MKIIKNIKVPTGNILIGNGQKRKPLEFLSLGDYGKEKNLKADFMGLGREINGVPHGELLPLTEKWVITISTQYGCSMGCSFCDVPLVGPGINATYKDLIGQVLSGIYLHPEINTAKRLNVHFARMGEPTWNPHVLDAARWMKDHLDSEYNVHPVVSTMMPKRNEWLKTFIHAWMRIKNRLYHGNAGLQISINSTNEDERSKMFNGNCLTLLEIREVLSGVIPAGRKITLNFALCDYEIDEKKLQCMFDPDYYLIKITPMHKTKKCVENGILTVGGYNDYCPYRGVEERLKSVGYDVIVFVPSNEEDKSKITCGNAVLANMNYE